MRASDAGQVDSAGVWIGLHGELAQRGWLPRGYVQQRAWGELLSVPAILEADTIEALAEAARARVVLPSRAYHPRHLCGPLRVPLVRDPWLSEGELVINGTLLFRPQADEGHERWSVGHGVGHVVLGDRGNHSDAQQMGIALQVDAGDSARAVSRYGLWGAVPRLRRVYRHVQPWALLVRALLGMAARGEDLASVA